MSPDDCISKMPELSEIRTDLNNLFENRQAISVASCSKFEQDVDKSLVSKGRMQTKTAQEILSEWLQAALDKRQLGQSELARAAGTTSQKVNLTLQQKRGMTAEELIRYSHILQAPIPALGEAVPLAATPEHHAAPEDLANLDGLSYEQEIAKLAIALTQKVADKYHHGRMPLEQFTETFELLLTELQKSSQ